MVYVATELLRAKVSDVPTEEPLVAICKLTEPVPVPAYFPSTATVMPVIVEPAGTLKVVPFAKRVLEGLDASRFTVAKTDPVITRSLWLLHVAPEP